MINALQQMASLLTAKKLDMIPILINLNKMLK